MDFLSVLDKVLGIRRKRKGHKLKWKLAEERVCVPVPDADSTVGNIEKKARPRFVAGGEYYDTVYSKEYGEGVYGYLIVRSNKKTEDETLVAETYMLNEEEKLGIEVAVGSKLRKDFGQMGYQPAFEREIRVWWFRQLEIGITVYDIADFGALVEFALPATNLTAQRDASEKRLFKLMETLGLKKDQGIPTDATTLQMVSMKEEEQAMQEQQKAEERTPANRKPAPSGRQPKDPFAGKKFKL